MSTVKLIGAHVALWCIARGSTAAFKVTAGMDNDLSDLKEIIRNKKPNDFANVDPDNLILWHVDVDQKVINTINDTLNDNNKLLISGNTVGATFHELGGTNIRAVVGAPIIEQPSTTVKTYDDEFSQLRTELSDMRTVLVKTYDDEFSQLRTELRTELSDMRTVLGDMYELSARSKVSKYQGSHYTSKFEIFNLFGLVRIALPRKLLSSEKNAAYDSQVYIASYRVNKLSDYIHSKKMGENLESSIKFIRTLPDDSNYNKNLHALANEGESILKQWRSFESSKNTTSNKKLYLVNTRFLSIMLLTSYVLDPKAAMDNGQAPFNMVLDIDFRGRVPGTDIQNITIELGEIKSSSGSKAIKKAYRQLLLRLAVLSFVVEAMEKDGDKSKCKLIGKIFVPREPEVSIKSEWGNGIRFSSSAEYRVDIVKIGEK